MPLQSAPSIRVVVTDTNILINFTHIGRLQLLGKLPPYAFVVPEQVVKEVKDPAQAGAIRPAISSGILQEVQLTAIPELANLRGTRPNHGNRRSGLPQPGAVPRLAHSIR